MSSATSDMSFEITVVGQVPDYVLYELNGFRALTQASESVLVGSVPDQAALIGVINRLHNSGIGLRGIRQL